MDARGCQICAATETPLETSPQAKGGPSALLARGWELFDVIAEKNPKTRMITVNKAGHFHFREYPEEFDYNIISFIDYWEHPPAGTPAKAAKAS